MDKLVKRTLKRPHEDDNGSSFPFQENSLPLVICTSLPNARNAGPSTQEFDSAVPKKI